MGKDGFGRGKGAKSGYKGGRGSKGGKGGGQPHHHHHDAHEATPPTPLPPAEADNRNNTNAPPRSPNHYATKGHPSRANGKGKGKHGKPHTTPEPFYHEATACACYVSGESLDTKNTLLGIGVYVHKGRIGTPADVISLKAFEGGHRRSATHRQEIEYFVPLSISPAHHRTLKAKIDVMKESIQYILDAIGRRYLIDAEPFPIQVLHAFGHLMSFLIKETMKARNYNTKKRMIDAYFALILTLERIDVESDGVIADYVSDRIVDPFMANQQRRTKFMLHDIGFLVAVCPFAGTKWRKSDDLSVTALAPLILQETLSRTVFDVVEGLPTAPGSYPELANVKGKSTSETWCAKFWCDHNVREALHLAAYQSSFALASEGLTGEQIAGFKYATPNSLKDDILSVEGKFQNAKSWDEFVTLFGAERSDESKKKDVSGYHHWGMFLKQVVGLSESARYHGGYRHEAYQIFLTDAEKRAKQLSWADIGKQSPDGVLDVQNKMLDYIPSSVG